jgi:hypothetical protein
VELVGKGEGNWRKTLKTKVIGFFWGMVWKPLRGMPLPTGAMRFMSLKTLFWNIISRESMEKPFPICVRPFVRMNPLIGRNAS